LGAEIVLIPFLDWLNIYRTRQYDGMTGLFIHAFSDAGVMAGNGTLALEILEDLPDVDAVITPYGGGGLTCGVAAAFRHFRTDTRLYAAEVESAAPVAASLAAGEPVQVEYKPSFVDGIGAPFLFTEMWDFARQLLDGSIVVTLEQTVAAIRLLAQRNRVIAEGAGAAAVAAALTGKSGRGKVVCVVSGGNIDADKLAKIFSGPNAVGMIPCHHAPPPAPFRDLIATPPRRCVLFAPRHGAPCVGTPRHAIPRRPDAHDRRVVAARRRRPHELACLRL
jgi:threonine dehydratase